jgi:hypothetical protein
MHSSRARSSCEKWDGKQSHRKSDTRGGQGFGRRVHPRVGRAGRGSTKAKTHLCAAGALDKRVDINARRCPLRRRLGCLRRSRVRHRRDDLCPRRTFFQARRTRKKPKNAQRANPPLFSFVFAFSLLLLPRGLFSFTRRPRGGNSFAMDDLGSTDSVRSFVVVFRRRCPVFCFFYKSSHSTTPCRL